MKYNHIPRSGMFIGMGQPQKQYPEFNRIKPQVVGLKHKDIPITIHNKKHKKKDNHLKLA